MRSVSKGTFMSLMPVQVTRAVEAGVPRCGLVTSVLGALLGFMKRDRFSIAFRCAI